MKSPRSRRRHRRGGPRHLPHLGNGPETGPSDGPNGVPEQNSVPTDPAAAGPVYAVLQPPFTVERAPPPPLSLERRCVRQFPRIALSRGRQYFIAGRASAPVWTGSECNLVITGTGGNYQVQFDFSHVTENQRLPGFCDCPAYAKGDLCKHLWTAILQIDRASEAGQVPQSGSLRIIHRQPRPRNEHRNDHRNNGNRREHMVPNHPGMRPRVFGGHGPAGNPGAIRPVRSLPSNWNDRLNQLQGQGSTPSGKIVSNSASASFVIAGSETQASGALVLDLWTRHRSMNGEFGPLRPNRVSGSDFSHFDDFRDQEVLSLLTRSCEATEFSPPGAPHGHISSRFIVDPIFESLLIPLLTSKGNLFLSRSPNGSPDSAERPLRMDPGKAWDFELKIEPSHSDNYRLTGSLKRGTEARSLMSPLVILRSGFLLFHDRLGRFAEPSHAPWAASLRASEFLVPRSQGDTLLTKILLDPSSPRLTWPNEMGWTYTTIEPKPKGVFRPLGNDPTLGRMTLTVSFDYAGREVALSESEQTLVDVVTKRVYSRNLAFEEQTLLKALEIMRDKQGTGSVAISDLHRAANELCAAGWTIHFENQKLLIAEDFSMDVTSTNDWFDLKMEASFGDLRVEHSELRAALESGSGLVKLADGSLGMLPTDWVTRYAPVVQLGAQFGEATAGGGFRFSRDQGLMLNAVLADDSRLTADAGFLALRKRIEEFDGVETVKAPEGFQGKLRDYQREGLTWLGFLEKFETGGILADDMGLGKTIQILAFLLIRSKKQNLPSLVIAPKSLTFNWIDEAARFAPGLRVIKYSGKGREQLLKNLTDVDLIVTTYGTLRKDIALLQEIEFDVAAVDEAQAIKNRKSLAGIACKKIRARHRLALTGTPIENSLNDLLSILEFTNPGLLGLTQQKDLAQNMQAVLGRVLKPFMLRRTKEKVLTELPEKSEQVLFCEMSVGERKFYNAIREKYRASLAERIEKEGLGASKMHVLAALLRLRQAACHPGLVSTKRKSDTSAKFHLLLNHIEEVTQEGHKVLVFSQFTSLLALLRTRLEKAGIVYEYLDGQTDDRKTPVERFQTDPKCPVFLISLKAGGTGLNLTAADYVFILDPWWNPAVEAQAISRAHRIGQSQKVFAYRMITRGTVEEKILELQATKRELAESIISEDQDFLRKLSRTELEHLLS